MISMIRGSDGVKVPVHQASGILYAYAAGLASAAEALTRLELLAQGPITGQDLTDLTAIRTNIDALITSTPDTGVPALNTILIGLRQEAYVNRFEKLSAVFEVKNDALLTEAQFRNLLGIPPAA